MAKKHVIDLPTLRKLIVEGIKKKHNMTITEFSNSKFPKQLKITGGNSLRCYLQGRGTSFATFEKLCQHLEIGDLNRKMEIVKNVTYFVENAKVRIPAPKVETAEVAAPVEAPATVTTVERKPRVPAASANAAPVTKKLPTKKMINAPAATGKLLKKGMAAKK
jgi:hypothetical protein